MTIRCAIYTRKSTEEGLEQQFNSLDNQRLACENYIMSQAGEGWESVAKHYDDGGYSGGNTERPGLQELFKDIEVGLVNCVVVYKIDRLTRSLLDFAKIVELFDKHSVSFVAVTQSFNTSNSMGRLMLHVLLSFAQYERELTSERVRDKIAASKKLGYWMGGYTPLGYDIVDKSLKINESEAETIRYIFNKFLEIKSITQTLVDIKIQNIKTKTGKDFCKNNIRDILQNPIYKGYVQHKDIEYKGLHEAIISPDVFESVQEIFDKQPERTKLQDSRALLKDIIRCGCCDCCMTPTYCNKGNKKYRYYACSNHIRKKSCISANKNVPAGEVEKAVSNIVRKLLKDQAMTALIVHKLDAAGIALDVAQDVLKHTSNIWETLHFQERQRVLKLIVKNAVVDNSGVRVLLNQDGLSDLILELAS
jgi:DNA invertase Pin-like site-specific DNA recombinase